LSANRLWSREEQETAEVNLFSARSDIVDVRNNMLEADETLPPRDVLEGNR
jgi:hypothetical protein